MSPRYFVFVLVILDLIAPAGPTQTYDLKIRRFGEPKTKIRTHQVRSTKGHVKISKAGQVVNLLDINWKYEDVFTLEVLQQGQHRPTKFKRTYITSVSLQDKTNTPRPLQGRTILFEWKNGAYQARAKDKPALTAEAKTALETNVNENILDLNLLPNKAVRVGETWRVDPKRVSKTFMGRVDILEKKSSLTGKLVKIYKKRGRQFGVLEFRVKLFANNWGGKRFDPPALLNATITSETVIDGSCTQGVLTATGSVTGQAHIAQGGINTVLTGEFRFAMEQKTSAAK